jgi:hypothetical protein
VSTSAKPDGIDTAFGLALLFIGYPLAIVWEAWIMTKLWSWFVMPTFDAPALTMPVAAGLALLVVLVRPVAAPEKRPDESHFAQYGRIIGYWFLNPALILVAATAIHAWFQ